MSDNDTSAVIPDIYRADYVRHAQEMLGRELPADLLQRLDAVDARAKRAGGRLVSRQTVAAVVEQWVREVSPGDAWTVPDSDDADT